MTLQILDQTTRTKRPFIPVEPGKAGLYVCGLTVQDRPHLGHMYAFVACDMIRRYLEYLGYEVTHVQNFTDIDDKIIEKARRQKVAVELVAQRNMQSYHAAAAALQIKPAHHYPRVTEHIPEIITFIKQLIARQCAYESRGEVYFQVRSWPDYGKLSGRDLDEMRSGIRVSVGDRKRDPLDFVLWKNSPEDEPGWDSPWGRGRPGWHIECSAMAVHYLGAQFDFHGGGRDLLFPHHENERAQGCCATGLGYVNHWLHNGLVVLGNRKMSKSDGNFMDMQTLLERYPAAVLRFFLLNAHFRSQLEFSEDRLREAAAGYARLERGTRQLSTLLAGFERSAGKPVPPGLVSGPGHQLVEAVARRRRRFFTFMDDDFNSGAAIGELFALVRDINLYLVDTGGDGIDRQPLLAARDLLAEADGILGIFPDGPAFLEFEAAQPPAEIIALCRRREQARQRGDWDEADALRDRISKSGWELLDTPGGYRIAPTR
jgi:cysteinyl-tRNA synthetase